MIKVDVNPAAILRKMGLGGSKEAQQYLASEVERLNRPYVPMSSGSGAHMVNQVQVTEDAVIYPGPYAHYQYVGEVMDGRAPKQYTGREIEYSDGPMRGKQWDKRMLADHGQEIEKGLENYIKGRLR
ncbi:MAG TPA: hypothetical protein DDW34_02060 [Clostridium sp.]|nr:hypothetical protein [Clostridium sp.]